MSCQHPEALVYVLVDEAKLFADNRRAATIFWCRGCGSLKGWHPRDQAIASKDEWQPPDGAVPIWAAPRKSRREYAAAFVPWPADQPLKYNGIGEPCDMWTGPCCCGATHREGR
jgi:hypothetical protein